jgi:hypothetical protein
VIVKNLSHSPAHADLSQFDVVALDKAVDLLKAYLFQRVQFLGKGVLLCYDDESKTVYLADEASNIAKLELGELKRWARCQSCGVEGFVDGKEPTFVNTVLCVKCSGKV